MEAAVLDEFIKTLQDRFAKNMRRHAKNRLEIGSGKIGSES